MRKLKKDVKSKMPVSIEDEMTSDEDADLNSITLLDDVSITADKLVDNKGRQAMLSVESYFAQFAIIYINIVLKKNYNWPTRGQEN